MGLLLKCEHVDFGYENQDAVIDVSLEVSTGDYICIVGENGSDCMSFLSALRHSERFPFPQTKS